MLQLHWANSKSDVFTGYKFENQHREHYGANASVEFSSVDRFYFAKEVELNPCIADIIVDETKHLDFKQQPVESLKDINDFVSMVTKGNIPKLLTQADISSNTKIVLANAAYFKGSWASKFDAKDTKREIFYSAPSEMSFVEMMSKNGSFNHGEKFFSIHFSDFSYFSDFSAANERLGCHVLEIPYEKSEKVNINMIVFLPPAVGDKALEKVLNNLTPEALHEALQDGFEREVQLKIPKFSTEKTIELLPVLTRMRVGDLFESSSNLAGFSNTTKLQLDDAIQKAKITIDEEGSTAAAATSLFSFRSSRPAEPAIFHCNHPFLYMIYDQNSRAILFAGIYRGPDKN